MKIVKPSNIGKLEFSCNSEQILQQIKFVRDSDNQQITSNNKKIPDCVELILDYLLNTKINIKKIKFIRAGTKYQQQVWDFLPKIPIGSTLTYGELAKIVGGSPRSVANALRHNPLPILFPCHRIVAKSSIGGFSGETQGPMIIIKRKLLQLEGVANA